MRNKKHIMNRDFLTRIILLCLIPILMTISALWYYQYFETSEQIRALTLQAQKGLLEIEKSYDTDSFIATNLNNIFVSSPNSTTLKLQIENFTRTSRVPIKYIIWSKNKNIEFSNIEIKTLQGNIEEAFEDLYQCQILKKFKKGNELPIDKLNNLRLLFGPQFLPKYINNFSQNFFELLNTDSAGKYPKLWIRVSNSFSLVSIIENRFAKNGFFLNSVCNNLTKKYPSIGFAVRNNNNKFIGNKDACSFISKECSNFITLDYTKKFIKNKLIIANYISNQSSCFAVINRNENPEIRKLYSVSFGLIIIVYLASFLFFKIVKHKNKRIRILLKTKFTGLFILFNLIPATIFFILGHNYLNQMRKAEVSRVYYDGMNYLEHIDNLYLTEETLQIKKLLNKIKNYKFELKQTGATPQNITAFFSNPNPLPLRFAFVSSSSYLIATENDLTINSQKPIKINIPHSNISDYQDFKDLTKVMVKLQKLFLYTVNNTPISAKQATEFDFLANSIGQTTSDEMAQHNYEHNGSITEYGFGRHISAVFSYSFSVFAHNPMDYGLLYAWGKHSLGISYIKRLYPYINKNNVGLKIMIFFSENKLILPQEVEKNKTITSYANTLKEGSNDVKIRTCKWKGEDYYMMGFNGQKNATCKLIGLYPVKKIQNKIISMKQKFILFGAIGFLMSILFGLSISRAIMLPIKDLEVGIKALNGDNLSWRIPDLGDNEFGKLGNIINETIEDRKELKTTNTLNTILFSELGSQLSFQNASIYGQASIFTDKGNDYLDYFQIEGTNKVGYIWGKIEKTGVAYNLLAAYFKSCTIIYQHLQDNHSLFTENISKLADMMNEKNKILSFQFISFDTKTKDLEVSNYGCNMPLIVDVNKNEVKNCPTGKHRLGNGNLVVSYSNDFDKLKSLKNALVKHNCEDLESFHKAVINEVKSDQYLSSMVVLKSSKVI